MPYCIPAILHGRMAVSAFFIMSMLAASAVCEVRAQASSPVPSDSTAQKRIADPNEVPYRTDHSFIYHVLATPAYILHGVTRPIRWGMSWLERRFPNFFTGKRLAYGISPILEIGGPVGVSAGVVAYHRNVFDREHHARLRAVFGSRKYNNFGVTYEIPNALGPTTWFTVESHYFNDSQDRFFPGGNAADRRDETRFSVEQADAMARLDFEPPLSVEGYLTLRYEHATTKQADLDEKGGKVPIPLSTPGLGTADRFSAQASVVIDGTRGRPRILSGTRLEVGAEYAHELGDDRFHYLRYRTDLRQFVPVPVLPPTRRIALRARLIQVEPLNGDVVPFYALSPLGGSKTLRGFVANRFSNDGSLLLNLEYRYPIWKRMDALLFFDAGQVFGEIGDIAWDRFHTSAGAGIHLLGRDGLTFRFEVARSVEGARAILTVKPVF